MLVMTQPKHREEPYGNNPKRKGLCLRYAKGYVQMERKNMLVIVLILNGWLVAIQFKFELLWAHMIWKCIWYGMTNWQGLT